MLTTLEMKEVMFPEPFLWGAGGAGHQIEGDNVHSQFNQMERDGKPNFPVKSGKACNHWELYREDIEMMADMKLQVYRMSLEWSRIEPEQGRHDAAALARYLDMLERLNRRGIKVCLTLHHWSHPQWFEALGGFAKRENVSFFEKYLNYLVPKIKDYVHLWVVLNEFNNHGVNPAAFDLYRNLLLAHARGYRVVKQYSRAPVSSTHSLIHWQPQRSFDPMDRAAAKVLDWCQNEFFIHAIQTGELVLPYTDAESSAEVKGSIDYWAVNYYTRHMASARTKQLGAPRFPFNRVRMIDETMYHEEFYPDGLVQHLPRFTGYPIYICENGCCCDDDRVRIIYLARHLSALREAMNLGADVRGYIHWSVMDNYEWGSFKPRFGLVHVDFETFKRTLKPSAHFYREIIEQHGITTELRQKYLRPLSDITVYEA
ncbi:MAG: Beta-glucosidase A [Verrucomicrobiae bacterium]|nr:Beta-glucosidase A [Verrucomicrobiae bacterium]